MRGRGSEEGQVLPGLVLLIVALLAGGMLLFQVGRAAVLAADAVTAADAAALAGAIDIGHQWSAHLQQSGGDAPFSPDCGRVQRAAASAARKNDGMLLKADCEGPGSVRVEVANDAEHRLDSSGGLPQAAGKGAIRSARAVVGITFPRAPAGAGVPPVISGGACPLSSTQLQRAADEAGLPSVPQGSALRSYHGCGNDANPSVAGLTLAMQASILRLERALGTGLTLSSGFRTAEYQARLCERTPGPCAPPGQSMHQYGLAIDVPGFLNAAVARAVRADPAIGLCQPLPYTDAVHFSHVDGAECAGTAGALHPGKIYGGDIGGFATFDVHLID
jgi:hypothetical protein